MGTAVKALIMLAVVVGGPLAYLAHGPLPPRAQQVVDRATDAVRDVLGWETAGAAGDCPEGICPIDMPPALPLVGSSIAENGIAAAAAAPPLQSVPGAAADVVDGSALQPLLDQLIAWGVGEYELTRWGSSGMLYRFRCAAPLANDVQHARQFEAVAESPSESVQQVVADIAAWRLARNHSQLLR
ncbi:MAG: hypothetical protein CMJ58_20705 [Planctomycetaceae bacterium]|nr:hypothetical protein [Planctomycetaceae bacterium]